MFSAQNVISLFPDKKKSITIWASSSSSASFDLERLKWFLVILKNNKIRTEKLTKNCSI
jgi:hypothetical protein